ncbi:kelch repeat-containing protein [Archangium sp.]|uniref:kelch repeat-containing protein n=1 Tax=Archangium sp. TaxID=1872627 RepID=UPI002D63BB23|nr:kelch repeat-containing protein [Archangium sp.]HYO55550.1 kelch repeat-containing protein [Archangium sp.]
MAGIGIPEAREPRALAARRVEAVGAWHASPGEGNALALARAYFPEFAGDERATEAAPANPEKALEVKLPAARGEALELFTRGLAFQVKPEAADPAKAEALREHEGAAFYGSERFWSAVGGKRQGGESGRWVTQRVEEYVVLPEGSEEHRERFEVAVPEGVSTVRDAGEYLEFLDARGVPVLRMHYLVARDGEGLSRQGQVRLRGVVRADVAEDPLPRYALTGRTLGVEMSIRLTDMKGPIVVDPGWSSTASMAVARYNHTATLLPSGKVLVAGGNGGGASAELYDPATRAWSTTGSMTRSRYAHTATLLYSGKVLVAGGSDAATAELYDPATGRWSQIDGMKTARSWHTATLLPSGKILVTGGAGPINNAELYDPTTGSWSYTNGMALGRDYHTATLLPSGKVLVVGSYNGNATTTAELYDPGTGLWSVTGSLSYSRSYHTATLLPSGKVLVVGGYSYYYTAELYDPATGKWSITAAPAYYRYYHTATLLPSGNVLTMGSPTSSHAPTAELYNPTTGTWITTGSMSSSRYYHTATLLPSGEVLVAGGAWGGATSELYDLASGGWGNTPSLSTARTSFEMALLPSGNILAAGGRDENGPLASAEVYDQAQGRWRPTQGMSVARESHTATLLPTGLVLVTGGSNEDGLLATTELYDPLNETWTQTGMMAQARSGHTATLLPTGLVLVTGGSGASGALSEAELYDPVTRSWRSAGTMASARTLHKATRLLSGKVLVTGGSDGKNILASAELYDPVTGTWSSTPSMTSARRNHTATLMSSGKVLVVGGANPSAGPLASTELYDPAAQHWSQTGSMTNARISHVAALLPSGRVMVSGGTNGSGGLFSSTELYDPVDAQWTVSGAMAVTRAYHRAVLLPSGRVLVAGGANSGPVTTSQVYDDTWASDAWRPAVNLPQVLRAGAIATLTGAAFRGISQASGGSTSDSSSDVPFPSLWSPETGVLASMPAKDFSRTSVKVQIPQVSPGHYLLFVNVNGVTGGRMVRVTEDNQAPTAQAVSRTTARRKPVPVTLQATDTDGDQLTYTVVTPPAHGKLTGTPPALLYTPDADHAGSDSFLFKVNDGELDSNVATASLWVTNSAPVAQSLSFFLTKNRVGAVTLAATDAEGDALTYTVVTSPAHGTLSGTAPGLIWTPQPDYVGTDSFTFKVNDGILQSQVVTVSLWVMNSIPSAKSLSLQTTVDTSVAVTLLASDADGDALTYTLVTQPAHGTLTGTPPALLYTPDSGFTGSDSFTYKAGDGTSSSRTVAVSLEVTDPSGNAAPSVPKPLPVTSGAFLQPRDEMVLSWDAASDAEGDAILYRVEVLREDLLVTLLSTDETKLSLPAGLSAGTYRWRVEAVDAYGQSSGFSDPREFIISGESQEDTWEPKSGCSVTASGGSPWAAILGLLALASWRRGKRVRQVS